MKDMKSYVTAIELETGWIPGLIHKLSIKIAEAIRKQDPNLPKAIAQQVAVSMMRDVINEALKNMEAVTGLEAQRGEAGNLTEILADRKMDS